MNKQKWTPAKVKDVAKIVSGATPKTGVEENWGGDIPWLTPKDLSDNPASYTSHGSRFLTEQGFNSCSTHMLPKGTVLLTSRAPVGYVSVAANDICTNQGFKSLVLEDGQVSEFWYYLLSANTETLLNYSGGSTFKELSKRSLEQIEFLIPPVEEQHEIVNFMQALDLMIQAGDREISSAEKLRQDALDSLLDQEGQGWEENVLGDWVRITRRNVKPENFGSDTIPLYSIPGFDEGEFPQETKSNSVKSAKLEVDEDSILISLLNPRIPRVSQAVIPGYCSTEFAVVQPEDGLDFDFLYYLFSGTKFSDYLTKASRGTTGSRTRAKREDILEYLASVPPLEAQEKIVEKMQTLDSYLDSAKRSQEALKQVRKDVLHALLSGDKDVREVAEMFTTDHAVA